MNSMRVLPALLLLFATDPLLAAQSSGISPKDETLIRELEANSWVAWKSHDAKFFQDFLSEDHVEIHNYGIVGKAAVVDGVRSPACVVQSYSLGPFSMTRVSATAVLVTYRAEQDTACSGQKVPSPVWATSLYVKRAGRWLNVMYQHTPIARS